MINISDIYVVGVDSLQIDIQSLFLLYQPILGKTSINFYLTLFSDQGNEVLNTHKRLSAMLNISMDEMETARKQCEEFQLLRTFVKEENGNKVVVYQCCSPLKGSDFLDNDVYSRLLLKTIGQTNYQSTLTFFSKTKKKVVGALEITEIFDKRRMQSWDGTKEIEYNRLKPQFQFSDQSRFSSFDYKKLLQQVTPLTFPIESRTEENLKLIGDYAKLYDISVDRMKVLIGRCINLSENRLDIQRLKRLCLLEKPTQQTQESDPYLWAPVTFLQAKQGGIPVTPGDKDLLAYLAMEMKLTPVVINVLVEYALENNENRLSKRYVQAIASQWVRSGVKTKEDAQAMTKRVTYSQPTRSKSVLPDYLVEAKKVEGKEISEEEKTKLMRLLEEVGD